MNSRSRKRKRSRETFQSKTGKETTNFHNLIVVIIKFVVFRENIRKSHEIYHTNPKISYQHHVLLLQVPYRNQNIELIVE